MIYLIDNIKHLYDSQLNLLWYNVKVVFTRISWNKTFTFMSQFGSDSEPLEG